MKTKINKKINKKLNKSILIIYWELECNYPPREQRIPLTERKVVVKIVVPFEERTYIHTSYEIDHYK